MAASSDETTKQVLKTKALKKGGVLQSAEAKNVAELGSALKAAGQLLKLIQSNPFGDPSNDKKVSQFTESLEWLQSYQTVKEEALLATQSVKSSEVRDAFAQSFKAHISNVGSADKNNSENTNFMAMVREETAANVASKKQIKKMDNSALKGSLLLDINTRQKLAQVNEQILAYTKRHNVKNGSQVLRPVTQQYVSNRDLDGLRNFRDKLTANEGKVKSLFDLNFRNNIKLALELNLLLSGFLTGALPEDAHLYMCIHFIIYIEQTHAQKMKIINITKNALDPILREPYGNEVLTCATELRDIIVELKNAFNFNPIFATYLIRCKTYLNPKALTADSVSTPDKPVTDAEQRNMVVAGNRTYFDYVNTQHLLNKKNDVQKELKALFARHKENFPDDPSGFKQLKDFDILQKENEGIFKDAQESMDCLDGFIYIYKAFELRCDAFYANQLKSLGIIEELYIASKATNASRPLIEIINDHTDNFNNKTHDEQVALDKKRIKEIEAQHREERSAAMLTQQKLDAEKVKAQKKAEEDRIALVAVKKMTLERVRTLDNEEYDLLLKIVNATNLHHSIEEPLFVKLATKLNALETTDKGYLFRLSDQVKGFHRVHPGDKINAEFLKNVSDILNHFELTETDIAGMRTSARATVTSTAKP